MMKTDRDQQRRVVLLVEDDADAQYIYDATLRWAGFDVVIAGGIQDAVARAEELRPDVVVLDCRLPDGDGLALARRWRSEPSMKNVPILVLTAFSARQDLEAALLAGADAFLVKPCPGNVLAAQVAKLMTGPRPSQRLRIER